MFRSIFKSFRTYGTAFQTEPLHSAYFHSIYGALRQQLFSNRDSKVVWNYDSYDLPRSLVSFLQVFSWNTSSSSIISPLILYPTHSVFISVILSQLEWLIKTCYTIIWFIPISVSKYDFVYEDHVCNMNTIDKEQNLVHVALLDNFKLTHQALRGIGVC